MMFVLFHNGPKYQKIKKFSRAKNHLPFGTSDFAKMKSDLSNYQPLSVPYYQNLNFSLASLWMIVTFFLKWLDKISRRQANASKMTFLKSLNTSKKLYRNFSITQIAKLDVPVFDLDDFRRSFHSIYFLIRFQFNLIISYEINKPNEWI